MEKNFIAIATIFVKWSRLKQCKQIKWLKAGVKVRMMQQDQGGGEKIN